VLRELHYEDLCPDPRVAFRPGPTGRSPRGGHLAASSRVGRVPGGRRRAGKPVELYRLSVGPGPGRT
jgi:hypothetical protein